MFDGFSERRVAADGFGIRVVEGGSGDKVVYLHGGGGLHLDGSHALLAEDWRLVAIELPGFGDSPENERSQSFDDIAATLALAIEAAGVEPPYRLIGTSLGGACALHVALARPDRVGALVLLAPAAFRPDDWRPPAPEQATQVLYAHPERVAPREPPPAATIEKQQRLMGRLLGSVDQDALRARMRSLDVPTLVVFGTDDRLIPATMGRIYREELPNCSYVLLYDAGHELGSDRPLAAAALIDDFLERREAFVIGRDVAPVAP